MNGESKKSDKATNQNNDASGCLSMLWWPLFYGLCGLWEPFHEYLASSGASETIRLLFSAPLVVAFFLLILAFFPISRQAPTKQAPTKKTPKLWRVFWLPFLLLCIFTIWHSSYGNAEKFQAHSRVNMTDNPTEEMLIAALLVFLLTHVSFLCGINHAKLIKAGDTNQASLWEVLLFYLFSSVISSYFFALYWPWPYMTGEPQSRLIALSPYTFPVASGLASALSFVAAYRRETRVEPAPEHTVTLRVNGPRDAIDVSYKIHLRGHISLSKRLIAVLPWEWVVPVHKGTYVSVEADPRRLSSKSVEPLAVQLLVDEKVVRENWATGRIVECHLVV